MTSQRTHGWPVIKVIFQYRCANSPAKSPKHHIGLPCSFPLLWPSIITTYWAADTDDNVWVCFPENSGTMRETHTLEISLSLSVTNCLMEIPRKEDGSTHTSQPMVSEVSIHGSLTKLRATSCEPGKERSKGRVGKVKGKRQREKKRMTSKERERPRRRNMDKKYSSWVHPSWPT